MSEGPVRGPHSKELQGPLGAKNSPQLTVARKQGHQTYSYKEVNSAHLNELRSGFFPHSHLQKRTQLG